MGNTICEYYSNVTAKPVDWLWYPYIPYGKLTVIQGDPGEGKSTFVLNLVYMIARRDGLTALQRNHGLILPPILVSFAV